MTGKELKKYAEELHDDAIIEIRESNYGAWRRDFEMQAPYIFTATLST